MQKAIFLSIALLTGCSVVHLANKTPQIKASIRDQNDHTVKNANIALCFNREEGKCQREVNTKTDKFGHFEIYNQKGIEVSLIDKTYHYDIAVDHKNSRYTFRFDGKGDMPKSMMLWCHLKDKQLFCEGI